MASGTASIVSTPCADGVESLPGVACTEGFDTAEIGEAIARAVEDRSDNSTLYNDTLKFREPGVAMAGMLGARD